jgi:hypothetical protein
MCATICITVIPLATAAAEACEGASEEGGFTEVFYKPGDLTWAKNVTGKQGEKIELALASDPLKLTEHRVSDKTDFEALDPKKCVGSNIPYEPSFCEVEINRLTKTAVPVAWYEVRFEDLSTKTLLPWEHAVMLTGN